MINWLLLASLATAPLAWAANATFYPTGNMTDTSGNVIQAHGGAILQSATNGDKNWYWFGEDKAGETTSGTFQAINCYKSADFATWEYVGAALKPIAGTNISSSSIVERPKVLYNAKNGEYVMWFHSDNGDYSAAMVGVATSKTITGPYSYRGSYKPFGQDSRDMTVWKDPENEKAYLIFATNGNADFEIAGLDDSYYNVASTLYTFKGVYYEAPGVFKINGIFYLLFSPQDGWTPTEDAYFTSTSMSGPWSSSTLLAEKGSYAYLTQNAYDITVYGSRGTVYLYFGDHWSGYHLGSSTYSFYPVIVSGNSISLHRTGGWTLDAAAGTWSDLPYTQITAAGSTTPSSTLISCTDGCAGGKTANMSATNTFDFTWSGSAGKKVISLLYTYNGYKNSFRNIAVTVDGVGAKGTALAETSRGNDVQQETPIPVILKTGSKVVLTWKDPNGYNFFLDGVNVYDDEAEDLC